MFDITEVFSTKLPVADRTMPFAYAHNICEFYSSVLNTPLSTTTCTGRMETNLGRDQTYKNINDELEVGKGIKNAYRAMPNRVYVTAGKYSLTNTYIV